MHLFAFVIHPIDVKRDALQDIPSHAICSESWVESLLKRKEPMRSPKSRGTPDYGVETEGWFIGCPLSPRMMLCCRWILFTRRLSVATDCAGLGAEIIGWACPPRWWGWRDYDCEESGDCRHHRQQPYRSDGD